MISSPLLTLILLHCSICMAVAVQGGEFIYSRATFYGSPDCLGSPRGACGFGEYGRTANEGGVSGVSRLYKNGTGCGACYQVRCKIPTHCSEEGAKVVVTDYGQGDHTDFILSPRAYSNLARPNMASELLDRGVVDIEYRRIPCGYTNNFMLRVHEHSNFPSYLAVLAMYQSGLYDITAVEVWLEDCKEWRAMRKAYGAVWDMANPPMGELSLRFQVVSDDQAMMKWVQLSSVLPSDWKAGVAYDIPFNLD